MAKYRVIVRSSERFEAFVYASSEEKAWEKARGLDGDVFIAVPDQGDWEIYDVVEA